MPTVKANGVELYYEESGNGDPVVFVHGSWGDAGRWARLIPLLDDEYRTVAYDRRGHSRSERVAGQGSIHEDVEDLAALVAELDLVPAHVVGNSFGAIISLRCAGVHPEIFRTLAVHEPPMLAIVQDDPSSAPVIEDSKKRLERVIELLGEGRNEEGAKTFVNTVAFCPETWETVFDDATRKQWTENAPTFLDESRDPDQLTFDVDSLRDFSKPLLLTMGTKSPPMFGTVIKKLAAAVPAAELVALGEADHAPHATHPRELAALLREHFAKGD